MKPNLALFACPNPNCPREGVAHNCYAGADNYDVYNADDARVMDVVAACRGLHLDNVMAGHVLVPSLAGTPYLPIVPSFSARLFTNLVPRYVAVTLDELLDASGSHARPNIRARLGIPTSTKIIGLLYGDDPRLEIFWVNREVVLAELAEQGLAALVAANFSFWYNHPYLEHAINQKRSLIIYDLAHKLGIAAIPHFYWIPQDESNMNQIAQWINGRPSIDLVAFNLQTLGDEQVWRQTLEELRYLVGQLKRGPHLLITGPQTPERIRAVAEVTGPRLTIAGADAAQLALHYRVLEEQVQNSTFSHYKKVYRGDRARCPAGQVSLFSSASPTQTDPGELFAKSIHNYEAIVSRSIAGTLTEQQWPSVLAQVKKISIKPIKRFVAPPKKTPRIS
ncbi:MAG TPA: DUF4417 domain-containing protein [Candidatus Saccharimonadales bacterium]